MDALIPVHTIVLRLILAYGYERTSAMATGVPRQQLRAYYGYRKAIIRLRLRAYYVKYQP